MKKTQKPAVKKCVICRRPIEKKGASKYCTDKCADIGKLSIMQSWHAAHKEEDKQAYLARKARAMQDACKRQDVQTVTLGMSVHEGMAVQPAPVPVAVSITAPQQSKSVQTLLFGESDPVQVPENKAPEKVAEVPAPETAPENKIHVCHCQGLDEDIDDAIISLRHSVREARLEMGVILSQIARLDVASLRKKMCDIEAQIAALDAKITSYVQSRQGK